MPNLKGQQRYRLIEGRFKVDMKHCVKVNLHYGGCADIAVTLK